MLKFKIARIQKGLSQRELADILGMSPATICKIETGKQSIDDLRLSTIKKIAASLDVSLSELLKCS